MTGTFAENDIMEGRITFTSGHGATNPGGGDGGDVKFKPSETPVAYEPLKAPGKDGAFIFQLANGTEFMRINGDGTVLVRGEAVATDLDVYKAFRQWIETAGCQMPPER